MSANNPIGVFDSGLGGLSIWKEINLLMPLENTVYLADSVNAPYGRKSKDEIIDLSIKNTELLISKNCKLIVVACNTATTNAISTLRESFDVPFIGIEPAIKPAALNSSTNKIGVLATKGTLSSELFISTSDKFRDETQFIEVVGTGLVELIEKGELNKTEGLLLEYLSPMIEAGVDNIVLGCSHYPFLIPIIRKLIPENIRVIDSGEAVARQTKYILSSNQNLRLTNDNPHQEFCTNGSLDVLVNFLSSLGVSNPNISQETF